jgi:tetratricopeptide (TPR) repeat protein
MMNSQHVRRFRIASGIVAVLASVAASPAPPPLDTARALLQDFRTDPGRIDRARDLLEAAVARDGAVDTRVLVTLSRAWFLYGENRAVTEEARLAAYERGRAVAERAIVQRPNEAEGHLWYAINLGSWAQIKGLLRSLLTLQTIRREVDTVLRLDPDSVDGHIIAGSLDREVPAILGGDKGRAEEHFKAARRLAPHLTGARIELAKLYIKMDRLAEARQELQGVLHEPAPADRPRWELTEVPQARDMLRSLGTAP